MGINIESISPVYFCETLAEIIVVDDGSTDNKAEVVRSYDGVRYVRCETNRGKTHTMDHAVGLATTKLLFFCDADLRDLTAETVTGIIQPVPHGDVDMFIGARSNWMQKAITLFALNSGERVGDLRCGLRLPALCCLVYENPAPHHAQRRIPAYSEMGAVCPLPEARHLRHWTKKVLNMRPA